MDAEGTFRIGHFPQQYEDYNKLFRFYELLREGRFTTTRCGTCTSVHWPPRTICPECLSDRLEYVDMPKLGRIYSYTVQEAGIPPGYDVPLVYALVDFDNGVRIFAALVETKPEQVATGAAVEVVIQDVTLDHLGRRRVLPFLRIKR